MKWIVTLAGDKHVLQLLSTYLHDESFLLKEQNNEFLLTSNEFESYDSHPEVNQLANDFIEIMNGIISFHYGVSSAITLGYTARLNETGGREIILNITDTVQVLDFGPEVIISNKNGDIFLERPGQVAIAQFQKVKKDKKASKIFRLLRNGNWEFANLYKIIEIIRSEKGNKLYEWIPKAKVNLLTHTANNDKAIGDKARHAESEATPPKVPMELEEAKAICKTLILKYIEDLPV